MSQLIPTNFHLRNFNKYVKLDLPASEAGNITFIGENAVGKTTLANCFFPMLIDGAISTPSFNPAKGIDKLNQNGNPRNSARDTRNFESILLGWGAGAMKVRTGYSYLNLRSELRQIIIGLGATRVVGDTKKPTWWFVVNSSQTEQEINLITTDDEGKGLSKEAFIAANDSLSDQLLVFDRAVDYREYAATKIYGFSDGETLGKLANTYRLLASPILTAGNAKFTPIRESLKNAQEGIDDDLIIKVANSQREVNRMNGILEHLKAGQKRLQKIKNEIFWRNLNHLDEILLNPYTEYFNDFSNEQIKFDQAQIKIEELNSNLNSTNSELKTIDSQLDQLRFKKAEQKSIEELKHQYSEQIKIQEQQLLTYDNQSSQLNKLQKEKESLTKQLSDFEYTEKEIKNDQLDLKEKLKSLNLTMLNKLLDESDFSKFELGGYLRQLKDSLHRYQSLTSSISGLSQSIDVVNEIKVQMGNQIDVRLQGPLSGRAHNHLKQDNSDIHDAGAAKIAQQHLNLKQKQEQILFNNSDLKAIIKEPELLNTLESIAKSLKTSLENLSVTLNQEKQVKNSIDANQQQIEELKEQIIPDFNVEETKNKINELKNNLTELKFDHELDQKLAETSSSHETLLDQQQVIIRQINDERSEMNTAKLQMSRAEQKLKVLNAMIELNLKNLRPYFPTDLKMENVDDILSFVKTHRVEVKNNNFAELTSNISHLIHHNNQNGIDRNALDTLFEERGHGEIASQMRQQRSKTENDITVVAFDLNQAYKFLKEDEAGVIKALETLKTGNDVSQKAFEAAAINRITEQYNVIEEYNQILSLGVENSQSIKLKVQLTPATVSEDVIKEACDINLTERPALEAEIKRRLKRLANNTELADDDDTFNEQAKELLDTRQWSNFQIFIKRRQNNEDEYEEVDDKFVQSGGSGAEKAQAMVLPLLLVPKMLLQQANLSDAPYLVMFDEFADKLDPETAKSFAQTISHFGFSFIATMPNGAQNKILADGVENIVYEITAPKEQNDGKYHQNFVHPALIWH
ncbi:SbcC/MukB-like Walker B domain-containing protein [Xylocopilactobacillus apis]|uniref:Chromosome segregation ATPase n=1 Tax=Xylocopilactobacillus apis TaxID=2932183 RepID=A0AAU9CRW4_9LACO|nr:SbcC/MukB-like Walker B domain-containing protein [Xylocopilactobacillus apis]BDR56684.1 chromosome segregation ATPase [Xylocopilactobacillus apis]